MIKATFLVFLLFYTSNVFSQTENILVKGDSTSKVNLYGDSRLKSIELSNKPPRNLKSNYRTNGYRILIYNGPDRGLAYQIRSSVSNGYPGQRFYLEYSTPNYIIKVGDFRKRNEAENLLSSFTALYPNAMIVNDIINVSPK